MFKIIASAVKALASALWPPKEGEDATNWRWGVFGAIMLVTLVLTVHIVSVKGYLSVFGISGVAYASDVEEINMKTSAILYGLYAPQVRAKVRERCDTEDAVEREKINQVIDSIKREYRRLSGVEFYPMPTCGEV